MAHSKQRVSRLKPDWRRSWGLSPDFPLFPLGDPEQPKRLRWAKKVRGRLEYFGKVDGDPKGVAALGEWLRVKDHLIAGRQRPPKDDDRLRLRELCNKFLASKRTAVDLGTLSPRTFVEYTRTTDLLIDSFGRDVAVADLGPTDFEKLYAKLAKRHGLTTIGREVTMVRSVFKYAIDNDHIERGVKFGSVFKSPRKADKRKSKAKQKHANGAKMFTADEVRRMLDAAGPQLQAMIYLGLNCALGNSDCATLPLSALDLKAGWLDFPRPKTGIDRRVPLWPKTVAALRAVIDKRREPRNGEYAGLVFLTRLGQPWVRYALAETKDENGKLSVTGKADDAIAKSTAKLLTTLGIKRPGLSFYALRHTFASVAGGCKDEEAVRYIMGHVDGSMLAEYVETGPGDDRLRAVTEHVHRWLFAKSGKAVRRG